MRMLRSGLLLVVSATSLIAAGCARGTDPDTGIVSHRDVSTDLVNGSDASDTPSGHDAPMESSTDPCAAVSACGACTTTAGCGFCVTSNRCLRGGPAGSSDGTCSGSNWAGTPTACTHDAGVDPCAGTASCGGCTGIAGCGWCLSTSRCLQGTSSGSHDGSCTGASWAASATSCPTVCSPPNMMCGSNCVDVSRDNGNCGSCGHACTGSLTCSGGTCSCPSGETDCGGACVNTSTDHGNCGGCGNACSAAQICSGGTCGCSGGLTACGTACANVMTDNANCGSCGHACTGGASCMAGTCVSPAPANDTRAGAVTVTLTAAEASVTGTTAGATHDGPSVPCGCTSAGDVWYRFTLPAAEVVYIDTAGSSYDTSLIITDSAGTPVPAQAGNGESNAGLCNDDSGCGAVGGFTSGLQSRTWGDFAAGTYYIVVGGCGTGNFTLHVQHVAHTVGSFFYSTRLTGNSTTSTILVGTSAATPTCGGGLGRSGEDVRWVVTCGANEFFSLCRSDCVGTTCGTYLRASGTTLYDPVMYLHSANTGTEVACDDDGTTMGGTNCQGTGGDTANYGSRLNNVALARGLGTLFVDERLETSGMTYTLVYNVQ